jgi:ABC-2 type transport system permease protein
MSWARKYQVLLRREFWEFRSLWLSPAIGGAFLMVGAILGSMHLVNGVHISIDARAPAAIVHATGAQFLEGSAAFIGLFAGIAMAIYLLDCLYGERKDRSILFWKSLPVSDVETVASKLVVALIAVPLLVVALALVLLPVLTGLGAMLIPDMRPHVGEMIVGSLASLPRLLGLQFVAVLWYAPIATYLMLASVLARHPPLIYAALPPVAIGLAESLFSGTHHFWEFVGRRLQPLSPNSLFAASAGDWATAESTWWRALGQPALWLGLVAAGVMLFAAIRLRRYRDDS